ncbi:MAG: hypothetical protein HUK15_07005, partial [Bacteroidales bacterium]|nr:hypothetical protein [Bacteroidales bacterium]
HNDYYASSCTNPAVIFEREVIINIVSTRILAQPVGGVICNGQSLDLTVNAQSNVSAGLSYQWYKDNEIIENATSATYSASEAGTYYCMIADGRDTRRSDDAVVSEFVLELPTEYYVCGEDDEVQISLPQCDSYAWSNGSTASQVSVGAGDYSVTVTNGGCSLTETFSVNQNAPYDIIPNETAEVCSGSAYSLELTSPELSSIVWAEIETENPTSVALTNAGMYHVSAFVNGCQYTDSILLIVNELPEIGLPTQYYVCSEDDEAEISLPEFDSYNWSNGMTAGQVQLGAGEYSVTVSSNGCEASQSFVVSLNEVSLNINNVYYVCEEDDEAEISLPEFDSYAWSNGSAESQVSLGLGDYSVTVASHGCEASAAFTVSQTEHYNIIEDVTAEICAGASFGIELNADELSNIVWTEIETETPESVALTEAGMYHVEAMA